MSTTIEFLLFRCLPVLQDLLLLWFTGKGFRIRRERQASPKACLVSLDQTLLWVGAICGGILSIPVTLFGGKQMPAWVWSFFEIVILFCLAMVLAYCHETVVYDASGFTVRSFLGRRCSYSYQELTGLSRKGQDLYLHCGKRKFRLDAAAAGRSEFLSHADRMYFGHYKKKLPLLSRKRDPMNGNLDTPWLYLILYLFMILSCVAFLLLPVYLLQPADDTPPKDAIELRTSFSSWEYTREEQGTLILYAPGEEKPFTLSWLDGLEAPLPDSDTLCSGETYTLTVREGEEEYWIYAIRDRENQPILSVRDRNNAYRNSQRIYCVFLELFAAAGLFVGIFGILVGRNPKRYPHWFRKLFYQDWAWVSASGKYHHDKSDRHRRRKSPSGK